MFDGPLMLRVNWPVVDLTCQSLVKVLKENLGTHENNSGDSTKKVRYYSIFSPIRPLFHRGKSLTVYLNVTALFYFKAASPYEHK